VTSLALVVPDGVDDPERPSGGNVYDRRVRAGLEELGWSVDVRVASGAWPCPDEPARAALADLVAGIPDSAVVLLDGLVASAAPDVLVPEARRLRLVVLVHLPLGLDGADVEGSGPRVREAAVLSAAAAVVTTSGWTRHWLLDAYRLPPGTVHVAEPGVDAADLADTTAAGGQLLCVAAVTPQKGHDVLVSALAAVRDLAWDCVCVGSPARAPGFAADLDRRTGVHGIGGRVSFAGARSGEDLDAAYAAADLLLLPSRAETYGMVVTEALARGLPVVATSVGGVPEALGCTADGTRPGLLVPPDDPARFAAAVRDWLSDAGLRQRLRRAARERRAGLRGWPDTSERISKILEEVAG
jgi:glycosyltransferase involved in cell wall biosynthesis